MTRSMLGSLLVTSRAENDNGREQRIRIYRIGKSENFFSSIYCNFCSRNKKACSGGANRGSGTKRDTDLKLMNYLNNGF